MTPDSPSPDPRRIWPNFYQNPTIIALAGERRWTVSTQQASVIGDREIPAKMPIDFHALTTGRGIWGAKNDRPEQLCNLVELVQKLPTASNNAFYLRRDLDQIMIIDIEKTCPDELAAALLQMPGILYVEVSMSGLGFHLVMNIPENLEKFPIAMSKTVVREPHGWFEVLSEHWITFTRKPLSESLRNNLVLRPSTRTWENTWEELAQHVTEVSYAKIDIADQKPEIPKEDIIKDLLTRVSYDKNLEYFNNDNSRYEYGYIAWLNDRLNLILNTSALKDLKDWSPEDKAWILFETITECIEHREKHEETRNGRPLLLNTALSVISAKEAEQENHIELSK